MIDTFRLMNQVRLDKYKNVNCEDLAVEFINTNNQSIIAEVFCRNFKLLSAIAYEPKYQYIDKDDKVDAVVQGVYFALTRFDISKGYVFNTFLIKNVRCQLANCIIYLTQARHKGISYSLDAMRENTDNEDYDVNIIKDSDSCFDDIILRTDLMKADLTDREKIICDAILENPDISNCELANLLKCHRHTVAKEKLVLQQKLIYLL